MFHVFYALKTSANDQLILVYPLSHIAQNLICHQWMVQNIHNWYIQDLKWPQDSEGQKLWKLKLKHWCLWFHREIVQDSESEVHVTNWSQFSTNCTTSFFKHIWRSVSTEI